MQRKAARRLIVENGWVCGGVWREGKPTRIEAKGQVRRLLQ